MRPRRRDVHYRCQFRKRIGKDLDVFGLPCVKPEVWEQCRIADAAVQIGQRSEDLPGDRRGDLRGVGREDVMSDFVVNFAERIGGRFAVCLRGKRPAENGLAHTLFATGNENARDVLRCRRRIFKKNLHALRDNAGSVPAQVRKGGSQSGFIFGGTARWVLAESEREAMNLRI